MHRIDRFHVRPTRRLARSLGLGAALALTLASCASPGMAAEKRRGAGKALELSADTSLSLGRRFEARGDTETALGLYQKALNENPKDEEALRALVGLAVRTGRAGLVYEQAAQLASKQPQDAEALIWLAASLNQRQRPEEALEALDRAEQAGGGQTGAGQAGGGANAGPLWVQRGIAHDLAGDHLEAQRAFSHAITLSPAERALPMRVALSLALQEDYPAALRILQMQVNDPAMEQPVRETLAIIYALSGQTGTALEIAGTAVPDGKLADSQRSFLEMLPTLPPQVKAYAAHYRRLPQAEGGPAGGQGVEGPATAAPASAMPDKAGAEAPGLDVFEVKATEVADEPAPGASPAEPKAAPAAPLLMAAPEPKMVRVAEAPKPVPPPAPELVAGPRPQAPQAAKGAVPAGQGYWLQLASFTDRAKLGKAWEAAGRKATGLLAGQEPSVESQPVNGTTYFRLMVGPYDSLSKARDMADKLDATGIKSVIKRGVADIEPLSR